MRTTVSLDDDVVAAVERLRRDQGLGLSEALNTLARAGATPTAPRRPFNQTTYDLGMRMDVTNISEVLGILDQEAAEQPTADNDQRSD